jgi:multidrug resistance efflux pump
MPQLIKLSFILPIDGGRFRKSFLMQGEMAFPGSVIMTVCGLSKPWIYIYVNERNLGRVKLVRG